jgi:hypothetical protein
MLGHASREPHVRVLWKEGTMGTDRTPSSSKMPATISCYHDVK